MSEDILLDILTRLLGRPQTPNWSLLRPVEHALWRGFVALPSTENNGSLYYAVESNPKTQAMYAKFGIAALPYEVFIQQGRPSGNNR